MARFAWLPFLKRFSREVIKDEQLRAWLPADAIASSWLGFAGATEDEIETLERRLGTTLPKSYRKFLQTSNGWRTAGVFVYDLLPTAKVAWFREGYQDLIDAWVEGAGSTPIGEPPPVSDEDYFVYGPEQDCCKFRMEYLRASLAISSEGDSAFYLLNPSVVTPGGEWEAWFFSPWNPGAVRYRSFWDMMHAELDTVVKQRDGLG